MTSTYKAETRGTAALLAVLTAIAVVLALLPTAPAFAQEAGEDGDDATVGTPTDVQVDRFEGRERVATSVEISEATFETSDTAIIAAAERFPDALTGNYAAGVFDAPILLVRDDVQAEVAAELERLEVENIVILGGTVAVPQAVEDELAADYEVERLEGTTRYETAEEIATAFEGDVSTVILTTGERFPDALAAGQAAFSEQFPILLTQTEALHPAARRAIDELDVDRVIILGGGAAVSADIEAELDEEDIQVDRFFGGNRFETAVDFAERFLLAELGYTAEHINIASGENRGDGADALAMGPHAGTERSPLILTPGNEDNLDNAAHEDVDRFLRATACASIFLHIAGGDAAVSESNEQALVEAANDCRVQSIELDPETVTAGAEVTATLTGFGLDRVETIAVSGDCVEDAVIFGGDAENGADDGENGVDDGENGADDGEDDDAETLAATFTIADDADLGECALVFLVTFDDERFVIIEASVFVVALNPITIDDDLTVEDGVITGTVGGDLTLIEGLTVTGDCLLVDAEAENGDVTVEFDEDGAFSLDLDDAFDGQECELTFVTDLGDDVTETQTLLVVFVEATDAEDGDDNGDGLDV